MIIATASMAERRGASPSSPRSRRPSSARSPVPRPALASELEAKVTDKVFFDLAIDSEPAGRVVVGVFGDASPIAAARFKALAQGIQGLGYRRSEINAVEYEEENGADTPLFIADPGVKAFVIPGSSTPVEGLPGGPSTDALLPELAKSAISHRRAGLVSLTVERGAPPAAAEGEAGEHER